MDFTLPATMRDCWIVNDGVMGGVSQSSLRHDPQGMIFEGQVSLENNGGFASMRSSARFQRDAQVLELTTRGDGKRYKLILRTEAARDLRIGFCFRGYLAHAPFHHLPVHRELSRQIGSSASTFVFGCYRARYLDRR